MCAGGICLWFYCLGDLCLGLSFWAPFVFSTDNRDTFQLLSHWDFIVFSCKFQIVIVFANMIQRTSTVFKTSNEILAKNTQTIIGYRFNTTREFVDCTFYL